MKTTKNSKLIATKDGWVLKFDGLVFAETKKPNALGTLIWALEAEAALDDADSAGDHVQLQLAKYWGGLLDRQGAAGNQDLDEEFVRARLTDAVELASDDETKKLIATCYFERMRETVLSREV